MQFFGETSASPRTHRRHITSSAARLFLALAALAAVQSGVAMRAGAASVTISPQRVTLQPGQQQRFTATTTRNRRVQWRANRGPSSGNWLYTGREEPGSIPLTPPRP